MIFNQKIYDELEKPKPSVLFDLKRDQYKDTHI